MDERKLFEAIEKSPQEIKDILISIEIGKFLKNIAQENELDEEKALRMIDETGYIVLGLKSSDTFLQSLLNLGLNKSVAESIAMKVSEKIFSPADKFRVAEKIEEVKKGKSPEHAGKIIESANKNKEAIIITKETKEDALNRLKQIRIEKQSAPALKSLSIVSTKIPMTEEGEIVHSAPHFEPILNAPIQTSQSTQPIFESKNKETAPSTPFTTPIGASEPKEIEIRNDAAPATLPQKPHYEAGKDPYREPLV